MSLHNKNRKSFFCHVMDEFCDSEQTLKEKMLKGINTGNNFDETFVDVFLIVSFL